MAEQGHYDKLRSIIARCKWTFTKIMHREVYLAYHHIGMSPKEIGSMFNKKQIDSNPFEAFSLKVLAALSEDAACKNVLVSPARIMSLMALLSSFTNEQTRTRIAKLLGITSEDMFRYLKKDHLLPSDNYHSWASSDIRELPTVGNTSSAWIDSSIATSSHFDSVLKEWDDEKVIVSLSSETTKQRMRDYVKVHTNGMIQDIEVNISQFTKVVFVDCLYFKGKWSYTFDTCDTEPDVFHSAYSDNIVPFMKNKLRFGNYYSCQTFQAIDLEYRCDCEDRSYSMRIYLPQKGKSCNDVLRVMHNHKNGINFDDTPVLLKMPRFAIKEEENISQVLNGLGLNMAQIPLYIYPDKNESLLLDDVIQKGAVKVTEKGTEAGISTYTSMILGKPRKMKYKEMNVNRPFIFEIIEKHSGLRLFAGIVNEV